MADYFSQTVIRPDIPRTAMTALEYKVLGQIFDHQDVGDDVSDLILVREESGRAWLVAAIDQHVDRIAAALAGKDE